jgi:hypothetical protein
MKTGPNISLPVLKTRQDEFCAVLTYAVDDVAFQRGMGVSVVHDLALLR